MATLYGNNAHFDVKRCVAAAALVDKKVNVKDEQPPMVPAGTARPVYIDKDDVLLGPVPITWHLTKGALRGAGESDVLCWMNWAEATLRPAAMSWVLPAASCMAVENVGAARATTEYHLDFLNKHLLTRTFLSGERISLADLAVAFTLLPVYQHVLEPGLAKKYQNVTRHYLTVMNQPKVKAVVGDVKLCEIAESFDAGKFATNSAKIASASTSKGGDGGGKKDKKGKKEKSAEPAKKADKKKKEAEPAEELDAADAIVAAEESKKDPFADLPKGNFDMDAFKRCYSNEDTETKAIPHFWEKFDPENYSIWYCKYKYPEDLTMVFMSCNLIGGMMQRLDKMRKHAFGSMALFGENNKSQIGGVWFWRGQGLAFELSTDWQVDYASYEWTKLDFKDPKTKTLVHEYLMWEGKFEDMNGLKFNQGKIFK